MKQKYVTVNQLLDFGIPRGLFWNNGNRDLPIEKDEMIIYGLKRGYSEKMIKLFIDYFGSEDVNKAFETHKKEISSSYYKAVKSVLNTFV